MIVWLSGSAVTEVKGEWDKRLKKESTVATRKVRGNGPNSKGGGPTTTNKTESKKKSPPVQHAFLSDYKNLKALTGHSD